MITSLSLKNFKGRTGEYRFGRGNLIQGRNFAGKSAIDQAIRCLVLGYVPGVAKTAAAMKMFASDYPMSIGAHLKLGPVSERDTLITFEKVKSAIKQTADDTLADKLDEPTRVLFDPTIFFGLADSARISKACELVQSSGITPDEIAVAIAGVLGIDITPGKSVAIQERHWPLFERWGKEIKTTAKTVTDLLAASEDFWKAEKKLVDADKKRMQATVEGVADLTAAEAATELPSREWVNKEIRRLNDEILERRGRATIAEANATAIQADAARAAELRLVVATIDGLRADVASRQAGIESLEADLTAADAAHANAKSAAVHANTMATAAAAAARRVEELKQLAATVPELTRVVGLTEASLHDLGIKLTELRAAELAADERLKAAKAATTAPKPLRASGDLRTDEFEANATPGVRYLVTATATVGAGGVAEILSVDDWRPLIDNADELEEAARAEEYELAQRLAEANEEASDATQAVENALSEQAAAESNLSALRERLTRATVAHESLQQQSVANPVPDVAALQAESTRTFLAADAIRKNLTEARAIVATKRDALSKAESAKGELTRITSKTYDASTVLTVEQIAVERATADQLAADVNAHNVTLQKIAAAEQDRKRIEEAAAARERVEADSKLFGKVIDLISQKKTELVSGSILAPLSVANKLAAGILNGPLVFEEGEIGMRVGDAFVSSRVFSGTETAIVMMGLTAGLAAKSALRVLLLDEIGRLDTPNAVRLTENLRGMLADGDIDQFILIGPDNPGLREEIERNQTETVIHV